MPSQDFCETFNLFTLITASVNKHDDAAILKTEGRRSLHSLTSNNVLNLMHLHCITIIFCNTTVITTINQNQKAFQSPHFDFANVCL